MKVKLCIAAIALLFAGTAHADSVVTSGLFQLGFPYGGWELSGPGFNLGGNGILYCPGEYEYLPGSGGTFSPCSSLGVVDNIGGETVDGSLTVTGASMPLPPPTSGLIVITGTFTIEGTIFTGGPIGGTDLGNLIVDGAGTYTYTLEAIPIGPNGVYVYEAGGAEYSFSSVPEPPSVLLLGVGLLLLMGVNLLRKRIA